ncbi:unnamed protein product [Effrenium voratum]|uniref:Uncharacterized protein n=1 Tax=Effrenium voratum TaxID=2562239 RepID=A0AA36MM79_9DINO|nr:unnamed protein product [Effrenium voratum]
MSCCNPACKACLTWPFAVSGRSFVRFHVLPDVQPANSFQAGRDGLRVNTPPGLRQLAGSKGSRSSQSQRAAFARRFTCPHRCACSALTQELAVLAQGACFAIESVLIIAVRSASVIGAL